MQAEVERRQAAARVASLQLDVAASIRQAARQVRSTAEREDAARAGADAGRAAARRRAAPLRRRAVDDASSSRRRSAICCRREVNLLQATLDYQSSLVSFEALQLAPAVSAGDAVVVDGSVGAGRADRDAARAVPSHERRAAVTDQGAICWTKPPRRNGCRTWVAVVQQLDVRHEISELAGRGFARRP